MEWGCCPDASQLLHHCHSSPPPFIPPLYSLIFPQCVSTATTTCSPHTTYLLSSPTPPVCFYGHYDVQPAHSSEGWRHAPFDTTLVNGYLYGRGVSDNKGPVLGFVYAVKDLLDSVDDIDDLPVNVLFILEVSEMMVGC